MKSIQLGAGQHLSSSAQSLIGSSTLWLSGATKWLARFSERKKRYVAIQLDRVDLSILACWDEINFIFSRRGPTCFGVAHVDKKLPGLSKWRDAAAAACVAFIEQRPDLCSLNATGTKDNPHRRPYQTYKKRRQNLDLHPSKNAIITAAEWDQDRDILRVAWGAGWGWESSQLIPTTT